MQKVATDPIALHPLLLLWYGNDHGVIHSFYVLTFHSQAGNADIGFQILRGRVHRKIYRLYRCVNLTKHLSTR